MQQSTGGQPERVTDPRAAAGSVILLLIVAGVCALATWRSGGSLQQPAAVSMEIDVNAASETELSLLPGIGPALAGRIVQKRRELRAAGGMRSETDLDAVSGIGPKTLAGLRGRITFGPIGQERETEVAPQPGQ